MAGGKWDHMMDQTHIGYTSWQEPRHNQMPAVDSINLAVSPNPSWGVAVEGSSSWWPQTPDSIKAPLPLFNPYDPTDHFIDVFNRSTTPFSFTISAGAPWIQISPGSRLVEKEQRILVSVDWSKAPTGRIQQPLIITGPNGGKVAVTVSIDNPAAPRQYKGFIETNGYVSIEAEHYAQAIGAPATHGTPAIKWLTIPDLGRTLSAIQAEPVTSAAVTPGGNSPRLDYQLYLFDTGTVRVQAYFSPILEFNRHPIHYAISFDDEAPQIIDCSTGNEARGTWDKMVADNIRIAVSQHRIARPGAHILKFWLVDPTVVLQKIVVDAGGAKPSYLGPPESPSNN